MNRTLVVVPDLFFATRIAAVARATGASVEFVPPAEALARCAEAPPARLIVDLHAEGALALVRALRADARTAGVRVTGFLSHVEAALRDAALAAGADEALARSLFVARLPALLAGDAAAKAAGSAS